MTADAVSPTLSSLSLTILEEPEFLIRDADGQLIRPDLKFSTRTVLGVLQSSVEHARDGRCHCQAANVDELTDADA